jgi:hypothetical protein
MRVMDRLIAHIYFIVMLDERIREMKGSHPLPMRDRLLQSGSGRVVVPRIRRAFDEGRALTFIPDPEMISGLSPVSPQPFSQRDSLRLAPVAPIRSVHLEGTAPSLTLVENKTEREADESVMHALWLIHRAFAELEDFRPCGECFVLIREVPEAPVFHHFVLRCDGAGNIDAEGLTSEGPTLYFGLLLFGAVYHRLLHGEVEMYGALEKLLMLEQKAIRTGYVPGEALKELVGYLLDESLSMYEQLALENYRTA